MKFVRLLPILLFGLILTFGAWAKPTSNELPAAEQQADENANAGNDAAGEGAGFFKRALTATLLASSAALAAAGNLPAGANTNALSNVPALVKPASYEQVPLPGPSPIHDPQSRKLMSNELDHQLHAVSHRESPGGPDPHHNRKLMSQDDGDDCELDRQLHAVSHRTMPTGPSGEQHNHKLLSQEDSQKVEDANGHEHGRNLAEIPLIGNAPGSNPSFASVRSRTGWSYFVYSSASNGIVQQQAIRRGAGWQLQGARVAVASTRVDGLSQPDVSGPYQGQYFMYMTDQDRNAGITGIVMSTSPTGSGQWSTPRAVYPLKGQQNPTAKAFNPNLYSDGGKMWQLTFSDGAGGIWQADLDPSGSGIILIPANLITKIATGDEPCLRKRGNWYYLFVSNGGSIRVGRSTQRGKGFVDRKNVPMTRGGGTVLLANARGPSVRLGQAADGSGGDTLVYQHVNGGGVGMRTITWTVDGWPAV